MTVLVMIPPKACICGFSEKGASLSDMAALMGSHLRALVGSERLPSCCQAPSSFSRARHSCWSQPLSPSCLMPRMAAPSGNDQALSELASLRPWEPP